MNSIIDEILNHKAFEDIDTQSLQEEFNHAAALVEFHRALKPTTQPQTCAQTSILSLPDTGYLITVPGDYKLAGDIVWDGAKAAGGAAITIKSGGVTLDLGGYQLTITGVEPTIAVTGISIRVPDGQDAPLQTVTVRNGSIDGFTVGGVSAIGVEGLSLESLTIKNGNYTNISEKAAFPSGILIGASSHVQVANCTVQNMIATAAFCAGFGFMLSEHVTLENCTVYGIVNNDGACQGYSGGVVYDLTQTGCSAYHVTTHYEGLTPAFGHTSIGFVYSFCLEATLTGCSAHHVTGCCDDAHGMSIFVDALFKVQGFTAKDVFDGKTPYLTGAKATGLEVYGWGVELSECTVSQIHAMRPQDLQAAGFSLWGQGIELDECRASDVKVLDETGQANTKYGYGVGFGWAPDPREAFRHRDASAALYQSCSALDCQVGFDAFKHVDSVWMGNVVTDCGIDLLNEPPGTVRTMTMNRCSEAPNGVFLSADIPNTASNNTFQTSWSPGL
jgi:hypothetical protein